MRASRWRNPASCKQLKFVTLDATSQEHGKIASEGILIEGTWPLQATDSNNPSHIALLGSACDSQAMICFSQNSYDGDCYVLGGSSRVLSTPDKVVTIKEGLEALEHAQSSADGEGSLW